MSTNPKEGFAWCVGRRKPGNRPHELQKETARLITESAILKEAKDAVIRAGIRASREQYSERLNFLVMLRLDLHEAWRQWRGELERYRTAAKRGERVKLPSYPQKLVDAVLAQAVRQLRLEFPNHSLLPPLIPLGSQTMRRD